MAAGYCYSLGIKSNNFFLKDNKKAFILWLNVPKVTAYYQTLFKNTGTANPLINSGDAVLVIYYRNRHRHRYIFIVRSNFIIYLKKYENGK